MKSLNVYQCANEAVIILLCHLLGTSFERIASKRTGGKVVGTVMLGRSSSYYFVQHTFVAGAQTKWWEAMSKATQEDSAAREAKYQSLGYSNAAFFPAVGSTPGGDDPHMCCIWEVAAGTTQGAFQYFLDGPDGPGEGVLVNVPQKVVSGMGQPAGIIPVLNTTNTFPTTPVKKTAGKMFFIYHTFVPGTATAWWAMMKKIGPKAREAVAEKNESLGFVNHHFMPTDTEGGLICCIWEAAPGKTKAHMQAFIDGPDGPGQGVLINEVHEASDAAAHPHIDAAFPAFGGSTADGADGAAAPSASKLAAPTFVPPLPATIREDLYGYFAKVHSYDDLLSVEKSNMIASMTLFQESLERLRDECVDIFVTKKLFRTMNDPARAAARGLTRSCVDQAAITAEWNHTVESTKAAGDKKKNIGSLENLRKLLADAQQAARGPLFQAPLAAIDRVYKDYLKAAGGEKALIKYQSQGFKKKNAKPESLVQPVPKAWSENGKDCNSLIRAFELEVGERSVVITFVSEAEQGTYGPITPNGDLARSLEGPNGLKKANAFSFETYMLAQAHVKRPILHEFLVDILTHTVPHAKFSVAPVASAMTVKHNLSQFADLPGSAIQYATEWLVATVKCKSLDDVANTFFEIRKACAGLGKPMKKTKEPGAGYDDQVFSDTYHELMEVMMLIHKPSHMVHLKILFEGMIVEIKIELERTLALKELMAVPFQLVRHQHDVPPAIGTIVQVNDHLEDSAERIAPDNIILTATLV